MTRRQRGAAWMLGLLLLGHVLDRLNLPFERVTEETAESSEAPAEPGGAGRADSLRAGMEAARAVPVPAAPVEARLAINRATQEELERLPRVGPVLAARIVAYREAHGPLRSLDDLQKVQGIGARIAARLAPLVRFD